MVKLNRRVTIKRWGTTKNTIGSPVRSLRATWVKWAEVTHKTGGEQSPYQQKVWAYDYKVVMRYEISRPTKESDTIEYGGTIMKIENVVLLNEGHKQWEVCRCSKVLEIS